MTTDQRACSVHMVPRPADTPCETHDWEQDGMARRLVKAMALTHGRGGINACRDCVARAYQDAKEKTGRA